jgi:hypothetical protein
MKKLFLLFAFISLTLMGCSDDSLSNTENSIYLPLSIGNWWEYDVYEINADNTRNKINSYKFEVVNEETEGNMKVYRLAKFENNELIGAELISVKDGNLYYSVYQIGAESYVEQFKFYDSDSEKWDIYYDKHEFNDGYYLYEITGSNEGEISVSIGGEDFDGILIKNTLNYKSEYNNGENIKKHETTETYYYQLIEGVGIFQFETIIVDKYDEGQNASKIELLRHYNISTK